MNSSESSSEVAEDSADGGIGVAVDSVDSSSPSASSTSPGLSSLMTTMEDTSDSPQPNTQPSSGSGDSAAAERPMQTSSEDEHREVAVIPISDVILLQGKYYARVGSKVYQIPEKHVVMSLVLPGLHLANAFGAVYHQCVQERKITHVLTASRCLPAPELYKNKQVLVVGWDDILKQKIVADFETIFGFIQQARQTGGNVLVHCMAGKSRSASVVILYLMRHLAMPYVLALAFLRTVHPVTSPNVSFQLQLIAYQRSALDIPPSIVEFEDLRDFWTTLPPGSPLIASDRLFVLRRMDLEAGQQP